jgi:hypothetical protein
MLFLAISTVSTAVAQATADDDAAAPFTALLFADDFENGSVQWNTWSFDTIKVDQNAFMRSNGVNGQGFDLLQPLPAADYAMVAKFRIESTDKTANFIVRLHKNTGNCYKVKIIKSKSGDSYRVALHKSLNGIDYRYGEKEINLVDSQPGVWHQIAIEGIGATINVSIDNRQLFALVDDEKPIMNGTSVMITGDEGLIVSVDEVEVWGMPNDPYRPANCTLADGSLPGITFFRLIDAEDQFCWTIDFFPGASLTTSSGMFSFKLLGFDLGMAGLILAILFDIIVFFVIMTALAVLLLRAFKRVIRFAGRLAGRALARGKAQATRALAKSTTGAAGATPAKTLANDVFISYSHKDKAIADLICTTLEAKKMKCWIAPRDVPAGQNYQESIIDAIDASHIMVLVYSGASNESPHVIREITRAVSGGVTIIPFRIEDVPLSKSMEYLISVPHWMEATEPPMDDNIDRLAARARSVLKGAKPASKDSGEGV